MLARTPKPERERPESLEAAGIGLPVLYVNRFYVHFGDVVRVTLGDQVQVGESMTDFAKAVVVMTRENAMQLANLIIELNQKSKESADDRKA